MFTKDKESRPLTWVLRQAADMQTWRCVLLMNFSSRLKLYASKPARTQSPKPENCELAKLKYRVYKKDIVAASD